MSFVYQNLPVELDIIDKSSEDDDQPTGRSQPHGQSDGTLQSPLHLSHKGVHKRRGIKGSTFVKKLTGSQDDHKHAWTWITHCLEDKPYELKDTWGNMSWNLVKRLLTVSILISAIVFGAVGQSFGIADHTLWQNFFLSEDAQLAAFGLLNTLIALLIRDSLKHISSTIITRWMVREGGRGADTLDFEMQEELSKPWIAVAHLHERRKRHGWRSRDILRFVLGFATGISILLQGAGMNTVGMPKRRWWPDTRFVAPGSSDSRFFFTNKTMRVASVNSMSMWDRSWSILQQGGGISWQLSHGLAAMSTLAALENLLSTVAKPAGWQVLDKFNEPGRLIQSGLNVTNTSTPSIQTIAINGKATAEMWDQQHQSGNKWAQRSIGWQATLTLTGIMLDASCEEGSSTAGGPWNASSGQNSTIYLDIGSYSDSTLNFSGATCKISVHQALFVVEQWIVENNLNYDRPEWSINSYGSRMNPEVELLPATATDADIALQLVNWFNAVEPNLQNLSSDNTTASFTSIAVLMSNAIARLDRGPTAMNGLAIFVSTIFSDFLTTFTWNFEAVDGMTTKQGPIRWQIYGSGPRLQWQWAIGIVLGLNIVVQLFDIILIVCYRQAIGLWLSLGGMLVAANTSQKMDHIGDDQGAGFIPESQKFVRYITREIHDGGDEPARATLISKDEEMDENNKKYTALKKGTMYGNQEG